jgi:hypothetical protein
LIRLTSLATRVLRVAVVLEWCYGSVTVVLQWCYSGYSDDTLDITSDANPRRNLKNKTKREVWDVRCEQEYV